MKLHLAATSASLALESGTLNMAIKRSKISKLNPNIRAFPKEMDKRLCSCFSIPLVVDTYILSYRTVIIRDCVTPLLGWQIYIQVFLGREGLWRKADLGCRSFMI